MALPGLFSSGSELRAGYETNRLSGNSATYDLEIVTSRFF